MWNRHFATDIRQSRSEHKRTNSKLDNREPNRLSNCTIHNSIEFEVVEIYITSLESRAGNPTILTRNNKTLEIGKPNKGEGAARNIQVCGTKRINSHQDSVHRNPESNLSSGLADELSKGRSSEEEGEWEGGELLQFT